jgi:hypothetical protein
MTLEAGKRYYVKACGDIIEVWMCEVACDNGSGVFAIEVMRGFYDRRIVPKSRIFGEYHEKPSMFERIKKWIKDL